MNTLMPAQPAAVPLREMPYVVGGRTYKNAKSQCMRDGRA
jgi:hypothetical protein